MPKLVVTERDRTYLVDLRPEETLLVGRQADCGLRIEAPRASRRHCAIEPRAGGRHAVRDLESTNGTTVNERPFTGSAPLADGDVIDAAGCRIVYWSRP